MDVNERFDHVEDILYWLHSGQWFGWSDPTNKIYENLVIHDNQYDKPTEKSLTDALTQAQSDFDAQAYARSRKAEYPPWADQLDHIYHNGIASWKADIVQPIKDKYPKSD